MIANATPLGAWTLAVQAIPEAGLETHREASGAELSELARALDIPSCERLAADVSVRAIGGGRFRVEGHVSAALTQRCVVSLDPVPATIEEPFDEEFWPAEAIEPEPGEHEHEALAHVEPEPIVDGKLEIGRLVYETVAAALPPYPRSPGVELEWSGQASSGPEPVRTSPFAALAKLKGNS
jgi:uncharacterized metal-binding protein YceD (DUF177 family)